MPKLTKTAVDRMTPGTSDAWAWCSELPGFGVRVQPSGRKTYIVRYRTSTGQQRKQTLARCCDMPPDQAREMARKVFAQVAGGADPAANKTAARAAPTVADLADRFLREHAGPFKKARSAKLDEKNIRVHIVPALGSLLVADLSKPDVLSLHGSLAAKPATANQCLALLSKACNLAEDWGWRAPGSNPCRRVRKFPVREREQILAPSDIHRMDRALIELTTERAITRPMADLVRLLLITGCRLTEIMHARREWVDVQRQLLLLPDSKVGQRRIPLSGAAMAIIKAQPASEWLIPGRTAGEPMQSPYGAWRTIKERAGIPTTMRLHDLRHTAGSLGHLAGLSQLQIAEMLGHRQLSTTERYLHGVTGDRAVVAERMGDLMAEAMRPALRAV